jgi:hypothetical protein
MDRALDYRPVRGIAESLGELGGNCFTTANRDFSSLVFFISVCLILDDFSRYQNIESQPRGTNVFDAAPTFDQ